MAEEKERAAFTKKEIDYHAELEAINRELAELEQLPVNAERTFKAKKSELRPDIVTKVDEPIFLTPTKIKAVKRDLSQVIPSGIEILDKRIIGFNKRELTIWSGSNGSGKSSILSQLALESVDHNFNVALFSGELQADRVMNWITLQGAGKRYAQPTKYENYYTIPEEIKNKISRWLDGKLYIYNNNHGLKVLDVIRAIEECIDNNKIDVVIIDNLMSLDLSSVHGDKYDKQTDLVLRLSQLSKDKKVHIHFVSHPRKSIGFLRKTDISGTADITNAADNVFLCHRCNNDFKRNIKEYFGFKDDNPLMRYDNVIEVTKNRDLGVSDLFVGLYYEKESKRFLNTPDETKYYGWEKDKEGFVNCLQDEIPFAE